MPRLGRPSRRLSLALAPLAALFGGCDDLTSPGEHGGERYLCSAIFIPALEVEVRDEAGRPAAAGARVIARIGPRFVLASGNDSLRIEPEVAVAGVYDVVVSKPRYEPVLVRGVDVPGGPCGPERPVVAPVVLRLQAPTS